MDGDDSFDDDDCLQSQALIVDDRNEDTFDLDIPPTTGNEYLRRVRYVKQDKKNHLCCHHQIWNKVHHLTLCIFMCICEVAKCLKSTSYFLFYFYCLQQTEAFFRIKMHVSSLSLENNIREQNKLCQVSQEVIWLVVMLLNAASTIFQLIAIRDENYSMNFYGSVCQSSSD